MCLLLLAVGATSVYAQQQQRKDTLVVARDGTGEYRNIQEAVEAVRAFMDYTVTIYIKNGIYKEKLARPQDFEGHSLSVSDVIALKRNGEVSVHYVDSIGFKDLQGFLDKQPERHSVLMNLKEKCDAPECNPTVCRKARDEHEL